MPPHYRPLFIVFGDRTRWFRDDYDLIGFKEDFNGGHEVFSKLEGKSSSI